MFQSAADTPLCTVTNGNLSSISSGTRHHGGPAGPIMTPANTAHNNATAAAGIHHADCRTGVAVSAMGFYFPLTAAASCFTRSTTRGPHRDATSSSSSTTLFAVTAVIAFQPGRAATVAAV